MDLIERLRDLARGRNNPIGDALTEAASALEATQMGLRYAVPVLDSKRPIPKHHKQWFKTLTRAFKEGNVALMTCGSSNGVRTTICMVNRQHDGGVSFVPVGELCEAENPYDYYDPPFNEEEDGS